MPVGERADRRVTWNHFYFYPPLSKPAFVSSGLSEFDGRRSKYATLPSRDHQGAVRLPARFLRRTAILFVRDRLPRHRFSRRPLSSFLLLLPP